MRERPYKIILLHGEVAIIDESDFEAVNKYRWYLNNGYPTTYLSGKPVLLHVFLCGRAPKGYHIDHINRNKIDNRRENLRIVEARENLRNRRRYNGAENPFYGKTHSKETRLKISSSQGLPVLQISLEGTVIKKWPSAMDVQREIGISNGNIAEVLRGNRKTAGGFIWKRP